MPSLNLSLLKQQRQAEREMERYKRDMRNKACVSESPRRFAYLRAKYYNEKIERELVEFKLEIEEKFANSLIN